MPEDPYLQLVDVGPCRIIARYAAGGMGVIYRGHHVELDLPVAVKFLHPHLLRSAHAAERFLREARLAARLNSPGIVRVFDCGEKNGNYYIIMEFVSGRNLSELLKRDGALSVEQSLRITEVVARALSDAMEQEAVIHRDIKPANILLTSGDRVKLTDLGLAKIVAEHASIAATDATTSGIMLGTPSYMSPEQFADAAYVDHRADIFSLGATLYHMLAGEPPFQGDNLFQIQQQIVQQDPASLSAEVPTEVADIVWRMLAKQPSERYQTYAELLNDLRQVRGNISAGGPLPESPPGAVAATTDIPSLKASGSIPRPATPQEDRVLLVVDIQNDFCPGGALGVPEGDQIVPIVNALAQRFSHVILTQDWHRPDHLSFASSHPGRKPLDRIQLSYGSQILWADHCVQGTPGAAFHPDLRIDHCELVIRKGYNREIDSYSAFFENDRRTPTGLAGYLRERGLTRLFMVGLATDFCVAYSALDARRLGFEVTVIENACRGIDVDGSLAAAWRQMASAGVTRA